MNTAKAAGLVSILMRQAWELYGIVKPVDQEAEMISGSPLCLGVPQFVNAKLVHITPADEESSPSAEFHESRNCLGSLSRCLVLPGIAWYCLVLPGGKVAIATRRFQFVFLSES